jgi:hypothetical protein
MKDFPTRRGITQKKTYNRPSVALELTAIESCAFSLQTFATGFEVLAAVLLKIQVFWDVTPCGLVKNHGVVIQGQAVRNAFVNYTSRQRRNISEDLGSAYTH